ncbi:chromatin modification-related protein EAF7-domain-containing protein [Gongronella butleri]|nr:chromatin modification-related protein EAF7-domain-containing protein [Gongronella butleri]
MSDIKVESREASVLSADTPASHDGGKVEWDPTMETALLQAVAAYRPVGVHKHFRILCIQRQFNEICRTNLSIQDIWDRLDHYFAIADLDDMEAEEEEEEDEEEEEEEGQQREFSLPADDFDDMMEHRQDTTRESTPADKPARTPKRSRSKREASPAVTESSVASTPEPEDGVTTRRKSARKSEANTPEPAATRSNSQRRTNRSGSSSTRTRRQTKKK